MGNIQTIGLKGAAAIPVEIKVRYCLYARKSTESEERQILSIDSQVKEMLQIAERDGLEIAEIRRESHSAKATGQRPVFNEIVNDIKIGKFNGILTWAADRLSRNAGDLGKLVDLMDEKVLLQIRTYGQSFTNSPNEKFMLMILGSHAKLENDNRGVNVRRGLRTRCEMGLRPGVAPIGYLNEKQSDRKCHAMVDPQRAPIIKQIFEKVGNERWSGRKVYHWLKFDLNFKSKGNRTVALSSIFVILQTHFYYGMFEYPECGYLREEDLIEQLVKLMNKIDLNEMHMRQKFEEEVARINKFQKSFFGQKDAKAKGKHIDLKDYAIYLLREGSAVEKREFMSCIKNKFLLKNKQITIEEKNDAP